MFQKQYKENYQGDGGWEDIAEGQVRSELGNYYSNVEGIVGDMMQAPGQYAHTPFALYRYVSKPSA